MKKLITLDELAEKLGRHTIVFGRRAGGKTWFTCDLLKVMARRQSVLDVIVVYPTSRNGDDDVYVPEQYAALLANEDNIAVSLVDAKTFKQKMASGEAFDDKVVIIDDVPRCLGIDLCSVSMPCQHVIKICQYAEDTTPEERDLASVTIARGAPLSDAQPPRQVLVNIKSEPSVYDIEYHHTHATAVAAAVPSSLYTRCKTNYGPIIVATAAAAMLSAVVWSWLRKE